MTQKFPDSHVSGRKRACTPVLQNNDQTNGLSEADRERANDTEAQTQDSPSRSPSSPIVVYIPYPIYCVQYGRKRGGDGHQRLTLPFPLPIPFLRLLLLPPLFGERVREGGIEEVPKRGEKRTKRDPFPSCQNIDVGKRKEGRQTTYCIYDGRRDAIQEITHSWSNLCFSRVLLIVIINL